MSANKIAETSTTAGAGDLTLAGAWSVPDSFITGNRTFNSFYGLNHRFPYMIQDKLGNWEKGVGYLSGASVLVRETVVDNSLSTTALIDFPAGEKLVMVPTDAGSLWPERLDSGSYIFPAGVFGYAGGTANGDPGLFNMAVFNMLRPMNVTALRFAVVAAVAGSEVKPVIYKARNQDITTMSADLIAVGAAISCATTGEKAASIGPVNLAQGCYLVGLVHNSTAGIQATGGTAMHNGFKNGIAGANVYGVIKYGSYANPQTSFVNTNFVSANPVRCGLEGRFL